MSFCTFVLHNSCSWISFDFILTMLMQLQFTFSEIEVVLYGGMWSCRFSYVWSILSVGWKANVNYKFQSFKDFKIPCIWKSQLSKAYSIFKKDLLDLKVVQCVICDKGPERSYHLGLFVGWWLWRIRIHFVPFQISFK